MKAIVHIGAEKTNASSIQQFLYLNRNKLQDAGYHFIQSAGKTNNRALPAYCVSTPRIDDYFLLDGITNQEEREAFKARFIKDFESELSSLPQSIHTVIISSEHFHSRIKTPVDMDNVYQLLSGHFDDIRIVCYLREQGTTCTKSYSTFLRSGGRDSFEKFLEECRPKSTSYNYLEMLKNWERCFGQQALDVSLFAKDRFVNRNLLDDFTAKIDPSLIGKLDQNVQLENDSLRPAGQVLARVVNLVFPLKSRVPEVVEFRSKCQTLIAQRMAGRGQQPDLKTWQTIYNRFVESNEHVRKKYFPDLEKLFAVPFEMELPRNIIDDEFTELVLEIVALIRESGIDIQMPRVYSRLWSVISTCVTDAANHQTVDISAGPSAVTLTAKDAHTLKDIALKIEKDSPQASVKLMTMAGKLLPNSPVIKAKLEEYSTEGGGKRKLKFIATYHGGEESAKSENIGELYARYESWLQSLDIPSGSSMIPVTDNKLLRADSIVPNDNPSIMKGYTIFQAESLEEAISIAKECPHLETGGTMNVSEISAQA